MSSLEMGGHEQLPDANADYLHERQGALAETTSQRVALNDSIEQTLFEGIPTEAISHLKNKCSPEQLPNVIEYLKTTKAAEFGGDLNIIQGEIWLPIIDDCIAKAPKQAEIAAKKDRRFANAETIATKTEVLETEKDQNDLRRTTVEGLRKRITGNLTGEDKVGQLMKLIADVTVADGFEEPERVAALKHLTQIMNTLQEMTGVFTDPNKQAAFEQIINVSAIDLGAATIGDAFAPVMAQVEMSGAFSDKDKSRLRMIVTGSEVQDVLSEKSEDGQYLHNEQNKRQIRSGVEGYTEPSGRQIIEGKAGDHIVTRDVSGWSGEDVGLLVELMHYWNVTESNGTTGFVENIYQVDFSVLDSGGAFDPLTVKKFQQIISHMTGGFAGYDGDMENFEEKQQLIQNQSRLLSDTQTAFGWENNQEGTSKVLKRLGVWNKDGHPNMDVIKSFGDYTQRYYEAGTPNQADLVDYLHQQNPEQVKPLTDSERETMSLKFEISESDAA